MDVWHYLALDGFDPVQAWIDAMGDVIGRVTVLRRIDRLAAGNFGDHKFCRDGVWELRIDHGPGYRVYYSRAGKEVVLLLCAGSKRSQLADINQAVKYWQNYQRRQT